VSPINRQALLHIVSVAERHALDVTIVSAPLLDELWRFEPFRERTQRVMAEVQEIVRGSPRVRVLATEPVLVSSAELDNSVDHVIHPAAERYTASILRALRDTRPTAP
jgi:methylthioribose-1-phosphate isomerase